MQHTILIVEDSPEIRLSTRFMLEDHNFLVEEAENPHYALEYLGNHPSPDCILLDMNFTLDTTSGDEGLRFIKQLKKSGFAIPTIAMTAWSSIDLAVEAMQFGAVDFIEKPWKNERIIQVIRQQLRIKELEQKNKQLGQLNDKQSSEFIWRSPIMNQLTEQLRAVAQSDANILLTGSNGTGKSQLAHYIHQHSMRHSEQMISVNMGAIPETLFESEMFGHKKGAFTDAKESRVGRFELANHGTLFLDEVANIPLTQQAKLLRVLESSEYEVVGSSQTSRCDIRLVCASNANFNKLIESDKFRQDLYFRINTLEFRVPDLTERIEDIELLANHYVTRHGQKYNKPALTLSRGAINAMSQYTWPGNVRELSHLMERAVLLAKSDLIETQDLNLSTSNTTSLPMMTLEQAEIKLIKQALAMSDNQIMPAAKLLGLTKSSMYRRLEKYDLN